MSPKAFHAADRSGIVLSGDGLLRKVAKARRLEVHGTLWLLEQLVQRRIITPAIASAKLEELLKHNDRLPQKECEQVFKQWDR